MWSWTSLGQLWIPKITSFDFLSLPRACVQIPFAWMILASQLKIWIFARRWKNSNSKYPYYNNVDKHAIFQLNERISSYISVVESIWTHREQKTWSTDWTRESTTSSFWFHTKASWMRLFACVRWWLHYKYTTKTRKPTNKSNSHELAQISNSSDNNIWARLYNKYIWRNLNTACVELVIFVCVCRWNTTSSVHDLRHTSLRP